MTSSPELPTLRRLDMPAAKALAGQLAMFEDLQTVLRCCERLVSDLALAKADAADDAGSAEASANEDVVVESVWTTALLSYARCFAKENSGALTEDDLTTALTQPEVLDWHKVLLQLREHYASPGANPREQFSVGVAQDDAGAATGIGVTSVRQPLVDDMTVRQTGAIAFALSNLVNDRIATQQQEVFEVVKKAGKVELDRLTVLEVVEP